MLKGLRKELTITNSGAGFTDITANINDQLATEQIKDGQAHLFLKHTSASLTINENCDPDVRKDLVAAEHKLAPEGPHYAHNDEGPDDMPAHIKSSTYGVSLWVPVQDGRLLLGTWQAVYLWEHRRRPQRRTIVLTVIPISL